MDLRVGDWSLSDWRGLDIKAGSASRSLRLNRVAGAVLAAFLIVSAGIIELRSSWLESHVLTAIAQRATFSLKAGPSPAVVRPGRGPYDQRLGLSELPQFINHLEAEGYKIDAQARDSSMSLALSRLGLFPIYHEKDQAGLVILDRRGRVTYDRLYPHQIYPNFESIPPLVVNTLLFIENRQMLDASHPYRNPAIQWGRLTRAVVDLAAHEVDRGRPLIGASTLATQLEKMRHSPGGRTGSVLEKARQIASASVRAYQQGPKTLHVEQDIICEYINSIPLAARKGAGEVNGLADGLHQWYGENFTVVNRLLSADARTLNRRRFISRARVYREVLSLLLALRQPSRDLIRKPAALSAQTNRYLKALARRGVISPRLRDLALRTPIHMRSEAALEPSENFVANKAPNAIRMQLLPALGLHDTYSLDHLDLTVQTTLDSVAEKSVGNFLEGLSEPKNVRAAGLDQYQLLDSGSPKAVIYSVTLYERGHGANLLRIRTDNYNQPLDINQGTRLQLGSTAKLRTLINYLQIIEDLHHTYAAISPAELKAVQVIPGDHLTQWALGYLSTTTDKGLEPMLRAALQRKYSASPGEAFFTAGGLHHFVNFERSEDSQIMTVSRAFQHSVNLVFIRLMRDIEHYYMFRVPGASPSVLSDANDPARDHYLARFADFEGSTFLRRFYSKYEGQAPSQALQTLAAGLHLTPLRAAAIFRSVRPNAGLDQFAAFLRAHLPASALAGKDPAKLYDKYGPDKFNLNDRGYLAHVHPLELWLLNYREQHPNATLDEILAASASARQQVYQWLFKTRYKHAQDKRIEPLLEIDAFQDIHHAWKGLGYPFDSLVPSYATSIGVSGDTPQALADLAGIILNGGVRYPSVAIQRLHFAEGTPEETVLTRPTKAGLRVLSPAIAALVRQEMICVVENGTGGRARGGFELPDGAVLPIGGKTGTGDNRFHEFGPHGGESGSHVVNRTAAFVFFIGNRFYGTILAFVPGRKAANYKFTSALAVQVLKDLEPRLLTLMAATTNVHRGLTRELLTARRHAAARGPAILTYFQFGPENTFWAL